jgi:glutamate/aspartate transport system substrate-binding protein
MWGPQRQAHGLFGGPGEQDRRAHPAENRCADLKVKYNLVTSQTRIPLVQNGTVDLECGSTGVTAERQKQVAFSYGFIYVKGQLLTAKDSGIKALTTSRARTW